MHTFPRLVSFSLLLGLLILTAGFTCRLGVGAGKDGGVFKSPDHGETWEQKVFVERIKNKDVLIDAVDSRGLQFDPQNPDTIYLATTEAGLYKTTDAGEKWTKTGLSDGNVTSLAIHPTDSTKLYATVGRNLYRSLDAGGEWTLIYTSSLADNPLFNVVIDRFDPAKVYVTDNGGSLYKSFDGGETWQSIFRFSKPIALLRIDPQDTRRLYVVLERGGLQFSMNGGTAWESLDETLKPFKGANVIHALTFGPQNSDWLYLGTNYGLLRSTDGGHSWEVVPTLIPTNTQPIRMITIDPQNSNRLYCSSQTILYRSEDGGQNWKPLRTLPSNRVIQQLLIHPTQTDILYAGVLTIKD